METLLLKLLTTTILSVCPEPIDDKPNDCMLQINNCAVELKGGVTQKSITKCVKEYVATIEG